MQVMYPTISDHSTLMEKLKAAQEGIEACYSSLWPGIRFPTMEKIIIAKDTWAYFVTTSFVVALLVWGITASKRSVQSRQLAATCLVDLIKLGVHQGLLVKFPTPEDITGAYKEVTRRIDGSTYLFKPWCPRMKEVVKTWWNLDVDQSNFGPTSRLTDSGDTKVYDFILWSLSLTDKGAIPSKRLLKTTAFTVLTQVAANLEVVVLPRLLKYTQSRLVGDIPSDSEGEGYDPNLESHIHGLDIKKRGRKLPRLSSQTSDMIAAKAAALLYRGDDSGLKLAYCFNHTHTQIHFGMFW